MSILEDNQIISGQDSIYASAVIDKKNNELIIKVINASAIAKKRDIKIDAHQKMPSAGKVVQLQNANLDAVNSFNNAVNISPKEMAIKVKNNHVLLDMQPYSFNIVRIPMK